jgi:GNAT superfamily N-acetyltransferase
MSPVHRLTPADASAVAFTVAQELEQHAQGEPLVSSSFDRREFERALGNAVDPVWVDTANGVVRGHLIGAILPDPTLGRAAWTGPDGSSFMNDNTLDNLLSVAYRYWRNEGITTHVIWSPTGDASDSWTARGYAPFSVRAALSIETAPLPALRGNYPDLPRVRRGSLDDIATAVSFDALIDVSHGVDPQSLTEADRAMNLEQLTETLEDPETNYFILDLDGLPVAQCITFPLPRLRGTFENTVYLCDVAVTPGMRNHGYAKYLVRSVLNDAAATGATHAEVRWRVINTPGALFWRSLGFRPLYTQLRRSLND